MMVVADLDELFIPIPDELLVNLSDSREVVEMLLETLPAIHQNSRSAETALGPAIRVAFKLMVGGCIGSIAVEIWVVTPNVLYFVFSHRSAVRCSCSRIRCHRLEMVRSETATTRAYTERTRSTPCFNLWIRT